MCGDWIPSALASSPNSSSHKRRKRRAIIDIDNTSAAIPQSDQSRRRAPSVCARTRSVLQSISFKDPAMQTLQSNQVVATI